MPPEWREYGITEYFFALDGGEEENTNHQQPTTKTTIPLFINFCFSLMNNLHENPFFQIESNWNEELKMSTKQEEKMTGNKNNWEA